MREREFVLWVQALGSGKNVITRCRRVESELGIDLDEEFRKDKGTSLIEKLTYTAEDASQKRPLRCDISFNSSANIRSGMSCLKSAVIKYFEFCSGNVNFVPQKTSGAQTKKNNMRAGKPSIDSYVEFLAYYDITNESILEWGLENTIFIELEAATESWNELKKRILDNREVYIRGFGRDAKGTELYLNLYKFLFNNVNVKKDATNNDKPTKCIQELTGYRKYSKNVKKETHSILYNYQVSHIWGCTRNVFMFEAPWNICFSPKLMDPFTGHESSGELSNAYKKKFVSYAYQLYKPLIEDYNRILAEYKVQERVEEYLQLIEEQGDIKGKDFEEFCKSVRKELCPIIVEE